MVAKVCDGRLTVKPRSRRPVKACGEVTSWTRCRSMYNTAGLPGSSTTMWFSQILSMMVLGWFCIVSPTFEIEIECRDRGSLFLYLYTLGLSWAASQKNNGSTIRRGELLSVYLAIGSKLSWLPYLVPQHPYIPTISTYTIMITAPQIRIKAWPMINNITSVFPYLCVAIMSIIYISPAIALSINPTNRYMKEMGRLLRDHRQLNVVASPEKEAPTLPYDVVDEEDSEDIQYTDNRNIPNNNSREKEMMEQAWSEQQFRQEMQYEIEQMPTSLDEPSSFGPAFSVFNDNQPSNQAVQMLRFDTPRPPSDLPPPPQDNAAFYEQAALKLESDEPIHNGFNQVPKRDTDLFQAFNEHIEALGQQIQETFTIKQNVIDEEYQQPVESELEYVDDIQGGYIQLDEGYSSNENSKVKPMEAKDNTFYAESVRGDFAFDATESVSSLEKTSFDATEQFQTQQYPPVQENNFDEQRALKQELERLESERRAAEEIATRAVERFKAERRAAEAAKQELERLAAEKRATEEESAKREMQERQRDNERQEQERIAAAQAKDELTEKLRQEKEDLEKELARQIAEQYRRLIESRDKEPTAIAKSKLVPRLPKTNDTSDRTGPRNTALMGFQHSLQILHV